MKKLFSKEFIIGLCVIMALCILFFGINYLKGINLFQPANYYTVSYKNVGGLETAAAVTIDGYKVGQVRNVEFDYAHPGVIKVTLALNDELRVPEDSQAELASSLLGGPSIVLHLGSSSKMLPVGGEIQAAQPSADLMGTVTNDIMPTVTHMLPTIDSLAVNLNLTARNIALLSANPALNRTVTRLDQISANIAALSLSLRNSLGPAIAQSSSQLPVIMNNTASITTRLDSVAYDLSVLSSQLKTLPLDGTMQNIEAITANLNKMSNDLNNPNGTLGKLMNDPALYNSLHRVTSDIDSLIIDIKKNPKRYISIKLL